MRVGNLENQNNNYNNNNKNNTENINENTQNPIIKDNNHTNNNNNNNNENETSLLLDNSIEAGGKEVTPRTPNYIFLFFFNMLPKQ